MAESKSGNGRSELIEHAASYQFFTPPQNVGYSLFADVDRPEAVLDIFERIPAEIAPSWVIATPNGAQAGWFIDPVNLSETGRDHPIRYARNIGNALRAAVGGDEFVDPLTPSRVRNPAYEPAETFAVPTPPVYRLGQLFGALKASNLWPKQGPLLRNGRPVVSPSKSTLTKGERNKGIFDAARFVAYAGGDYVAEAWATNDRCDTPLGASEVNNIINSIARFVATKNSPRVEGSAPMPDSMRQALSEMGRRGGLCNSPAQQQARAKGPAAAAAARKNRAEQQARKAQQLRRKGHSRLEIAAKLGRAACTISRYLRRWIPCPLTEMLACITGASGERIPCASPLRHSPTQPHTKTHYLTHRAPFVHRWKRLGKLHRPPRQLP